MQPRFVDTMPVYVEPSFPDVPDTRFIVKIKKLCPDAVTPSQSNPSDAAFDLYSVQDAQIAPQTRQLIKTGISIQIPFGFYGQILGRSGLALKKGICILGGVIDSGYLGEICVIMYNSDCSRSHEVKKGDRIAQIVFLECKSAIFQEVEQLSVSSRGANGFGSTG